MSDNRYEPTTAPLKTAVAPVRWRRALAVWWSASWRAALYALAGGFVFGFIAGLIAYAMGTPEKGGFYGSIAGYVASVPASMLGMKQALSRHIEALVDESAEARASKAALV
ncbi:MAG TPA: hypothetical protein VMF52_20340 [Steroidobacteraceae bacterium]|nr:hypothetical protein [Steroidobacteraceae bacterium]